jgi:hypothetical protein
MFLPKKNGAIVEIILPHNVIWNFNNWW